MSRSFRFAIAACWLVVAFLLLRMAYGGSLFGILYVIRHDHPAVLIADAVTIMGAFAVAILLARGATRWALRVSIALAFLAIPLSLLLVTQDHGSAPVVGAAAVVALALSLRALPAARPRCGSAPGLSRPARA